MISSFSKYKFIFSIHTFTILCLSLLSCFLTIYFEFKIYLDFLVVSIMIAFPLSITLRESMRRREKALANLSQFKAAYLSIFYCVESSEVDRIRNLEITNILKS